MNEIIWQLQLNLYSKSGISSPKLNKKDSSKFSIALSLCEKLHLCGALFTKQVKSPNTEFMT